MESTLKRINSSELSNVRKKLCNQNDEIQSTLSGSNSPSNEKTNLITGIASIGDNVSPSDTMTISPQHNNNALSEILIGENLLESIHNESESYKLQILASLGCSVTALSLSGAILAGGVVFSSSLLAYHYVYKEPTENVFFPESSTLFTDFLIGFSARAYLELGWNCYVQSNDNNDSNRFMKDLFLIGLFLTYQLNINNDHNQPENIPQNLSQFIDLTMFSVGSATSSIAISSSGYFATFFTNRQNTENHCRKIRSDIALGLTSLGLISFIAITAIQYFAKPELVEQPAVENTPPEIEKVDLCNDPKNFGVCMID